MIVGTVYRAFLEKMVCEARVLVERIDIVRVAPEPRFPLAAYLGRFRVPSLRRGPAGEWTRRPAPWSATSAFRRTTCGRRIRACFSVPRQLPTRISSVPMSAAARSPSPPVFSLARRSVSSSGSFTAPSLTAIPHLTGATPLMPRTAAPAKPRYTPRRPGTAAAVSQAENTGAQQHPQDRGALVKNDVSISRFDGWVKILVPVQEST